MMTSMQDPLNAGTPTSVTHQVHLPKPTAWPFLMALGLTLLIGSIVMNIAVGALGLMLVIMGAVGWFRNVLPTEKVVSFEVAAEMIETTPESHTRVRRITVVYLVSAR